MKPGRNVAEENADITHPHGLQALDVAKGNSCCSDEVMVGSRLRRLRHEQGLTIRSLAEKCGISMNTLSLVENNRTSPSVHTLNLLANGLGVPLVTLFEQEKIEPALVYQHAGERQAIRFANGTAEKLGQGLPPLGAEPIVVTLDVDSRNSEEISHEGREFIYCLEGEVTCLVAGQSYVLKTGDSLLFDAGTPHRWENTHSALTRLLVLFCPMEARDEPAERHLDR
jgi:transcriptional regulator with XRE-family HTH domain